MANLDLSKYGITGVTEIVHNPSYDVLFAEETKPGLEGFEKGHSSSTITMRLRKSSKHRWRISRPR